MRNQFLIQLGKLFSYSARVFNRGNGTTWPGHIALKTNPNFIKEIAGKNNFKTIIVAGTNGKTTTTLLIKSILKQAGKKVIHNSSGANLLNGIASTLLLHANSQGKINADYAIFEIDENTLPLILNELTADYVILLNLFRDQLDRYGEVNTIARKCDVSLDKLPEKTTVILNADDPQIAYLAKDVNSHVKYFGLNDKKSALDKQEHATDSAYCPQCGTKLSYKTIYYSHLGDWYCPKCDVKRPQLDLDVSPLYPLIGTYNKYNTNAAVLLAKSAGVDEPTIKVSLTNFSPAFGRQEVIKLADKRVQVFLAKNPTGFNETLRTLKNLQAKNLLIVLNDRIPDGRDISWIWDIDFEEFIADYKNITISGLRAFDMGVRIKYAGGQKFKVEPDLKQAINLSLENLHLDETLYILPTYSAMLEVRKILKGRRIL